MPEQEGIVVPAGEIQKLPEDIAMIISEVRWIHNNADYKDGRWVHKTCGTSLRAKAFGRTLWEDHRMPMGGFGEVTGVCSPYCPTCEPNFEISLGTGVYRQEIVQMPGREFC